MDPRYADIGGEEDGDEAKLMDETYAPMALALYVGILWCRCFLEIHLWDLGLIACWMCLRDGTMPTDIKLK